MDDTTKLHLVAGFLGSGKTTAIINAAKLLMAEGKLVGVVTNDQGKYLVDTAFYDRENLPAVEVGGGCFCCNFNDLEKQLINLKEGIHPDVIFAESVGSCSDLVATVIKPLTRLKTSPSKPTSFSVFTDARLLKTRLSGESLPFSENIEYIFDQQIEEAGLLVINKIDLIPPEKHAELAALAQQRYPDKTILLQNSLEPECVSSWLKIIQQAEVPLPNLSIDLDYEQYSAGEKKLAWLDEVIRIDYTRGQGTAIAKKILHSIFDNLYATDIPVGHLKFFIQDDHGNRAKVSFTTIPESDWEDEIPDLDGTTFFLTINARAEVEILQLQELIEQSLLAALKQTLTFAAILKRDAFYPNRPKPLHRLIG
jgi:Ni2+-binding GTPase involved in maturation of urease and hydrogenase